MAAPNVDDFLTTIGITIKLGTHELTSAYDFGDMDGAPEQLDCTVLSVSHKLSKPGLQEQDLWEVSCYWNKTDFQAVKTLQTAGTAVAVEVTFPDGTKATNTGVPSVYTSGGAVNSMQSFKVAVALQGDGWTWTYSE